MIFPYLNFEDVRDEFNKQEEKAKEEIEKHVNV
jgi:hypothetical protein